jgi:Protein of unknown function (DUF3999)
MKQLLIFVSLCALTATSAAALAPADFAYGMPLTLEHDAALYSLPVPQEVYRHTVRADLGDMRVFNSGGEWVTYSVSTPIARTTRAQLVAMPIFPLHGNPARALDRIRITIASDHGALNLQADKQAVTPAQTQAYVIDVRKLDRAITALELHWPDDAAEFSGRVALDSSDNLGAWSSVANDLPIVNLNFGNQHLVQNRLEFPALQAKYLRLRWLDRPAPFAINKIRAEPAPVRTGPPRQLAEISGQPVADQLDTYTFSLDLHAPVDRVNVKLPQANAVATITLSSRARPDAAWHEVTTLQAYDLHNNGEVLRNAAAIIPLNTDAYWRMQAHTADDLGRGIPSLQVDWIPQEITFVARGTSPFELAFGSGNALAAVAPLSSLLADPTTPISVGKASAGPIHKLGGPQQLAVKREHPWKNWLLWGALIGAVMGLAVMAHRLFHQLSK